MKLLRYGNSVAEKPGALDDEGNIRDLSSVVDDIDGSSITPSALAALGGVNLSRHTIVSGTPRLGPCVTRPGKFICIGLNYADHAAETNTPIPTKPVIFMKATSAARSRPLQDALAAAELGADGIAVSNHGGRQLDGVLSSARALPMIVDAVGDRLTVLVDSGVRSGLDIVRMLALGAGR